MRIEFVIANRGFSFLANEYDWARDGKDVVLLALFWKQEIPIRIWRIHLSNFSDEGHFSFSTVRNGKKSGWEFQGPIRRIG